MGRTRRVHFVGVGGVGMCGLAEVLLNLGYEVSGSDLRDSAVIRRLARLGVTTAVGHDPAHLSGADVVVVSSAVRPDNPEVLEARRLKVPVIRRAEMLAELMRMKQGIAIAGSHGKTTTTSMVATVLAGCGLDPTIVVGGRLAMIDATAKLGGGDLLVAEADESDGSFLQLSPTLAVVTNVDDEHLDHYGHREGLRQAFVDFLNRVPFYGAGLVCLDDPGVRSVLPGVERRVVTYGLTPQADLEAYDPKPEGPGQSFSVRRGEVELGRASILAPGLHNVRNALAALAVALELEISFEEAARALAGFAGVDRRFEVKGEAGGVTVVDDYGHHPTEIEATLEAARALFGDRRLLVGFQPHRFTRTRDLAEEFHGAFHGADAVIVADIYPAGEPPLAGVSAEALVVGITAQGHREALFVGSLERMVEELAARSAPGDVVLVLGAGDVSRVPGELLEALERSARQRSGGKR